MDGHSQRNRLGIRFRMSLAGVLGFLGLVILLIVGYPSLIVAEKTSPSRQPEMGKVKITRAVLQITNACPQPHYFRVTSDIKDPNFKAQTDAILVRTKATQTVEVLSETGASQEKHKATIECLDCKKEDGCVQDRYEVPINITSGTIALKGKTPSSASSPRSAPVLARINQPTDVGIIPETPTGCPSGSEHIYISMDDQDDVVFGTHNNSYVQGWTGDISHYSTGTTFSFCRVDGNQFHPFFWAYAVLQLGSSCPAGSISITRLFDNENNSNHNWSRGNIGPNISGGDTELHFCFFPAVGQITGTFPLFYVPYGVFAGPSPQWLAQGKVHTDDEDDNPQLDSTTPNNILSTQGFSTIIYGTDFPFGGRNSELLTAKVANAMHCYTPCPVIGSYDGANCWLGQPPSGTTAFIWSTNFYYTPVNHNQCPKPGSSYDGANCFVMAIPPTTTPFIWSNMWYVAPVCHP